MFKKVIAFLILFFVCRVSTIAQTCNHTNLSLKYDYKISVKKEKDEDDYLRIRKIAVEIINKSTRRTEQTIVVNPEKFAVFFEEVFTNCSSTRSYITGYNKKKQVMDGDYGDVIVADLNFDGKEDLAIKGDSGGNGGPFYKFFTMRKDGTFQKDDFLSNNVGHYPDAIDSKNKTLSTFIHASAYGYNENVYKYNVLVEKWIKIKTQYHDANEESKKSSNGLFNGTRKFCDESNLWYYLVTISQNNITLKSFAGKKNTYHKNKTTPQEIIKGVIKGGKIITKDAAEYLQNRFSFENGVLMEINNEGGYNPYTECK